MTERFPLPREIGGIPRRARVDMLHPTERAVYIAESAVEGMAADERLTCAGVLLARARELVADYLEDVPLVEDSLAADNARLRGLLADAHTTMNTSVHDLIGMQQRIEKAGRCR